MNVVLVGTAKIANVPLYAAIPTPVIATVSPAEKPWGELVVIATNPEEPQGRR